MNFTRIEYTCSLLIVGLGLAANGYSQSYLTNADFELPGIGVESGDFAYQANRSYALYDITLPGGSTFLPGWTVGGTGVQWIMADRLPKEWWPYGLRISTSGNYSLNLYYYFAQGDYRGGSISQNITNLKVGTNYFVFFDLMQSSLGPNSTVTVQIGAKSFSILNSTWYKWQTQSIPFTATASSMILKFSTPQSTVQDIYLDNVRVSAASNAPVVLSAKRTMGIKVDGNLGDTYRVEYSESLNSPQWFFLSRVTLTNSAIWVYDDAAATTGANRFYRSVQE